MWSFLVVSIIALITTLLYCYSNRAVGCRKTGVPTPKSSPILGNVIDLIKNTHDVNNYVTKCTLKLGGTWVITVPIGRTIFYVMNYENFDFVLKNPDIFVKGEDFRSKLKQGLGDGIFNADGEKWRVQRKVASKLFTNLNFNQMFLPIFKKNLDCISKKLDSHVASGKPLNFTVAMGRYALDSFSEVAYSKPPSEDKNYDIIPEFSSAFERSQSIIDMRFRTPMWRLWEQVTGVASVMKSTIAILDDFTYEIIDKRLSDVNNGVRENKYADIMDGYLSIKDDEGKTVSRKALRDFVLNILVAGRDTTTHATTWLIFALLKDKNGVKYIQRIIEEFEHYVPDGNLTYDQVRNDLYLFQAVFYEALRLFPPVPKNLKVCSKDMILPKGNILVKKGENIAISAYCSARYPPNWGSDACEFKPERWLGDIDNIFTIPVQDLKLTGECPRLKSVKDPRYIVFNSGPRRCLGAEFSLLETAIILHHMLTKYKFEMDPSDVTYNTKFPNYEVLYAEDGGPVYCESLTMPKRCGIVLKVEHRNSNKKGVNHSATVDQATPC